MAQIFGFLLFSSMVASASIANASGTSLDAHEHGTGKLIIAAEGGTVAMQLEVPAADIVGFEYRPKTDAELQANEAALALLKTPKAVFALSENAKCTLVSAQATGLHDEHDEHDDHDGEEAHKEFTATYELSCEAPDQIGAMTFAYFDSFKNAQRLEVQLVSSKGAFSFDVDRDSRVLDLTGAF